MRQKETERGYVMVVVLLIITVLITAGLFGVKTLDADLRASNRLRKSEILARAAEAGAAHRVSEISLARGDAGAALQTEVVWTQWPPANTFPASYEANQTTQYQVSSDTVVTMETRPPAGEQIGRGGQATVWNVTSYAISSSGLAQGEHSVSVGVRVWSRGGTSYNN